MIDLHTYRRLRELHLRAHAERIDTAIQAFFDRRSKEEVQLLLKEAGAEDATGPTVQEFVDAAKRAHAERIT